MYRPACSRFGFASGLNQSSIGQILADARISAPLHTDSLSKSSAKQGITRVATPSLDESLLGDWLNPPASTRSPGLELPSRESEPNLPQYKYLFRLGRAYLSFYKTGLKAIVSNYQLARRVCDQVVQRKAVGGVQLQVKQLLPPFTKHDLARQALQSGQLTRAEYQLLFRTKSDLDRLPLFGLVFMVCGEFTPLLVKFLSPVVPKVVWLPTQWAQQRKRAERRRQDILLTWNGDNKDKEFSRPLALDEVKTWGADASEESTARARGHAQWLGLYPSWCDRLPFRWPSQTSCVRRLSQRVEEYSVDDSILSKDGNAQKLHDEEVDLACDLRGLDCTDVATTEKRRLLESWLSRTLKSN